MFSPFNVSPVGEHLLVHAQKIAAEVSRLYAVDVDQESRFPHESVCALRDARLMGAYIPIELGGEGATPSDIAAVCYQLGQACSSTAMVYAMHQIQVACLVHHGLQVEGLRAFCEQLATHQYLLASATTELGVGGDVRTSLCAVDTTSTSFSLRKEAPVISYADYADAILVTARRSLTAQSGDQVIVVVDRAACTLEQTSTWDALGMRGTCSNGYVLTAKGSNERVLSQPYADISSQTMLPVSHIWWASLWLGIATDAVNTARSYLRVLARKTAGDSPPIAADVAALFADLEMVSATVASALRLYESLLADPQSIAAPGVVLRMNALKTSVSSSVIRIVTDVLHVVGISGYRNDSPNSVGRQLRDVHSSALMVHNERILQNSGRLLCVYKGV